MMQLPRSVQLTEIGPRDGLQNERQNLATADKIELIRLLAAAGFKEMEVTSFVNPKAVPNLADAVEVMDGIRDLPVKRIALIPNAKGYERAKDAGVDAITLVMSATDSHNQKNVNRTTQESIEELAPLAARARDDGIEARLALSMTFGCPFEGNPGLDKILHLVDTMTQKGFARIGLCDTIGIANPHQVYDWVSEVVARFSEIEFELHFHNTYGRGLANVLAGLEAGVRKFDSCVGGLGGCPFAPGATGNVATEDVASMLEDMGIATHLDIDQILKASQFLADKLGKRLDSNLWQVRQAQCRTLAA